MTKLKKLSALLASLAVLYSLSTHLGGQFEKRSIICQNGILKAIQPWDSACFYSAVFESDLTLGDLHYEKYRLDLFAEKGGYSPIIKWYRSLFYQKFGDNFEMTEDQIEFTHWELIRSQPYNLQAHAMYLNYLDQQKTPNAAQSALDKFCTQFIKLGSSDKRPIDNLEWIITDSKLVLDFTYCQSRVS
jgi:hypothetical protein